jgi:nicotinamide riboside kinase
LKIAFIGTHGVGKTTLCYDLAGVLKKQFASVDIVKEVARSCPLPINRDTTLAAQSWILHTQIAMEIASAANHQVVICDRSVLDNYAYLVAATPPEPALDSLVDHWMGTYDHLFKVPLGAAELKGDGIRDLDRAFQREIDGRVDRLLAEKNIPHLVLPPRARSLWMSLVRKAIGLTADAGRPQAGAEEPGQMPLPLNPVP